MAYNLQSLITILQQILNPQQTRWIVTDNKTQLESLFQKVVSLNQNLENYSGPKVERLESRIRDATEKAEDVIECHMVNQMISRPGEVLFTFSTPDLQQVMEEFDSAMEQVVEIAKRKTKMPTGSSSSGAAFLPEPDHPSSKNVVVGVDKALLQLKDRLTGQESQLEIVPIVGMGGIGKTKLARNLYDDPLIIFRFDVCAWTTISQDYNVHAVLLGLLRRPKDKFGDELADLTKRTVDELRDILYKRLYGKRYMVVLDDMWSPDVWDVIKRCFPDNYNGSRIVLTTRESEVAKYVGRRSLQHKVQLLNISESWKLLKQIVFGGEDCPESLEGIGRKIASDCGGLPLAINVIGGLLSKAKRSRDAWGLIANDVSAAITESKDDQFSNVLDLSYNHLPNKLKPCFLYMGAFPEDYVIEASRLIRMWVAEGFLESNGDKSLEEEAEDYLEALVERNLVLVRKERLNGKASKCGMHDVLRDLCSRKAGEEKFVYVKNETTLHYLRRASFHTSLGMEDMCAISFARSLICTDRSMTVGIPALLFFVLRLVRVLDLSAVSFLEFPVEVLQLVNVRYLAFSCSSKSAMPREITRLLNLQTLIAHLHGGRVPSEILEMPELRYLKLDTIIIIEEGYLNTKIKEKLERIHMVTWNSSFIKTIPNVRELGIYCDEIPVNLVVDLRHLHKLESLKCMSDFSGDGCCFMAGVIFPCSLRKLTIQVAIFPRVSILCVLPNLEVLKLVHCWFFDDVFEATEGDVFSSLKYLHFESLTYLVRWSADDTNFPRLQRLVIAHCPLLEEIPSGVGDISTLRLIELCDNNPAVEASARQIQEEQQSEDNYDLQLRIWDN